MQVFNARTQQIENVTWSTDTNNELIATLGDGSFVKFPAGTTQEQLAALVAEHQAANAGQEIITPEELAAREVQRKANEALIAQLNGNTMPEGQSNVATGPQQPATN